MAETSSTVSRREPRLWTGRGGSGSPQPHRVRDVLPGAPTVLRAGRRHLPVQRQLQRGERLQYRRRPVLLAAHRASAADLGLRRCRLSVGHYDLWRREADRPPPRRPDPGRAGRGHRAGDRNARPHHGGPRQLCGGARAAGFPQRRERHRRHGDGGEPQPRPVDPGFTASQRVRGGGRLPASLLGSPLPDLGIVRPEPDRGESIGDRRNSARSGALLSAPRRQPVLRPEPNGSRGQCRGVVFQ